MYRVVIVDDEVIIRVAITNLINWEQEDFVIVDSFENGVDALEFVSKNSVDLVITDIRMPLMSGIELMQETHKVSPNTYFIVLSAFDEFSYARAALQQGALSYILKMELSRESFLETIRKAKQKLDEVLEPHSQLELVDQTTKQKMKQDILREILFGNRAVKEQTEILHMKYQIDLGEPYFCVVSFIVDDKEKNINVMQFILEMLEGESIYATWSGYEEISILFNLSEKDRDQLQIEMKRWIQRIQFIIKQYYNQVPTFYVSEIQKGAEHIPQTYLQAYQTRSTQKYVGNGQVMLYSEMVEKREETDYKMFEQCASNIQIALHAEHIQDVCELVQQIIGVVKQSSYVELEQIRYFANTIIALLNVYLGKMNIPKEQFWGQQFSQYDVLSQLNRKADFIVFLYDLLQKLEDIVQDESGNHIVKQVKRYLKQNYAQDVSLSQMSKELGVSVNYLSTLFKKVTGETLKDYRIYLRMEKAMDLLRNSNEQISSIALTVGYDNEQYFSRFFKQKVGCTPSQYRNANQVVENETNK